MGRKSHQKFCYIFSFFENFKTSYSVTDTFKTKLEVFPNKNLKNALTQFENDFEEFQKKTLKMEQEVNL